MIFSSCPNLIPAISSKNEKYVKTEANSSTQDNLLSLPRRVVIKILIYQPKNIISRVTLLMIFLNYYGVNMLKQDYSKVFNELFFDTGSSQQVKDVLKR